MKVDYAELLANESMFDIFMTVSRSVKNETLSSLYYSIKAGLDRQGAYNEKLHASIFIAICETVGGVQIYIPSGEYLLSLIRDVQILKEFDGANQKQLAIKYGMTVRNIQLILSDQRKTRSLAKECIHRLGVGNA